MDTTKNSTLKVAAAVALSLLGVFILLNGGSTVVALVLLGVGIVALTAALTGR